MCVYCPSPGFLRECSKNNICVSMYLVPDIFEMFRFYKISPIQVEHILSVCVCVSACEHSCASMCV